MKKTGKRINVLACLALALGILAGCGGSGGPKPRLSLFIGVDVSGSFEKGKDFEDALDFLAVYLYGHLKELGGLEAPYALFVGSIGGSTAKEPKTFFPIQTFQDKSVKEIGDKLRELFPKVKGNAFTDYNAFFAQVAETVRNKNLVLKPVSIVMLSDGKLDMPAARGRYDFRKIDLSPLENLSRSITLRLLYTDAVTAGKWQRQVPRRRVKIWTQDAVVMRTWNDPKILLPGQPMENQARLFSWIKDNVDFGVRARRVD